jgi:hypothetical protein
MHMLVRIGQYVITNQLSGAPVSYLSQQLGNCLITVKRLFDKFIVSTSTSVERNLYGWETYSTDFNQSINNFI